MSFNTRRGYQSTTNPRIWQQQRYKPITKVMGGGSLKWDNQDKSSYENAQKYARSRLFPILLLFGAAEVIFTIVVILLTFPGSAIDVEVLDDDFHRYSLFWSLFTTAMLHFFSGLMRLATAFMMWMFSDTNQEDSSFIENIIRVFWSYMYQLLYSGLLLFWDVVAISLVTGFSASSSKELDVIAQVFPAFSIGVMLLLLV